MTTSILCTGTLTAADATARTLTYRLLPFGAPGQTSIGTITASRDSVTVPEDVSTLELNEEHDFTRPLGRFTSVEADDNGLNATISIVPTRSGDDALVLAREGLRTGISVELADAEVADGQLVTSRLTGAALVVRPAFADARLATASATPDTKDKTMTAGSLPSQPAPIHASEPARTDLGRITFQALADNAPGKVSAALTDLKTSDDKGKVYLKDQDLGELFEARKTERPVINSIGVKPLNSLVLTGKRKQRTFAVADWAGNKAEMPSGKFTTSQETWKASAKAVAVDVALELVEFGSADVMADLWEQAIESYITQTEGELVAQMLAAATAAPAVDNVIAGVSAAAQAFARMGARMSSIAVAPDVYGWLLTLPTADAPWWFGGQARMDLAAASFDGAGIGFAVSDELPAGTVMIYDRRAVDYRESRDIRLSAVNVAQGGYDLAFAKFRAAYITDPAAVVKFTVGTGSEG